MGWNLALTLSHWKTQLHGHVGVAFLMSDRACVFLVYSHHQTRSWTHPCSQLHTTLVVHFLIWPTSSSPLRCPPRWTRRTLWPSPPSARPTARAAWPPTSPTWASVLPAMVITWKLSHTWMCIRYGWWRPSWDLLFVSSSGIPTSSQPTMTVTAQRRQPPVVPLTLTSDLHLQQSPQQLSPTLSSPVNITQVRLSSTNLKFDLKFCFTRYGKWFGLNTVSPMRADCVCVLFRNICSI